MSHFWGSFSIETLKYHRGDKYIIKDYEGNELASGKMEAGKTRTPRPSEFHNVVTPRGLSLEK